MEYKILYSAIKKKNLKALKYFDVFEFLNPFLRDI